ncbi:MAG: hypothetical protein H7230_01470 [Candidatus Parcubacteria bacterium]|nr:hypothetical protein [Candidatus Paceibacterota bacterium]
MTKYPTLKKNNVTLVLNDSDLILDIIDESSSPNPRNCLPVFREYIKNILTEILLASNGDIKVLKTKLLDLVFVQDNSDLEFTKIFTKMTTQQSLDLIKKASEESLNIKTYIEQNQNSIDENLWIEIEDYQYRAR